jgi:hypothetical protein
MRRRWYGSPGPTHNEAVSDRERRGALERMLSMMPVDAVVRQVDAQALIDRIDVQALIDRVDLDAVLARVDLDRVLARVDINELIDRIDVNAIAGRIDVEDLVARTEIGELVVQSTTGLATKALDTLRAQGVGLDQWMNRWVHRILRRPPGSTPEGPPLRVSAQQEAMAG